MKSIENAINSKIDVGIENKQELNTSEMPKTQKSMCLKRIKE